MRPTGVVIDTPSAHPKLLVVKVGQDMQWVLNPTLQTLRVPLRLLRSRCVLSEVRS